jgi:hypothetical protein
VWRVVGIYYGLLCGEWWEFIMSYFVAIGGNLLCVIVWRVVGIYYRRFGTTCRCHVQESGCPECR